MLLALLTLAAALAPAAMAQSGTSSSGSIVLGTGLASYPPGEAVLFTLRNTGSATIEVRDARLEVLAGGQVKTVVPVGNLTLGAHGSANVTWLSLLQGQPAPPGQYFGLLKYTLLRTLPNGQVYPTEYWSYVNEQKGWLLQQVSFLF